jgi:catalase-peroxidase
VFTSGFEGPWSNTPTQWDNDYFQLLLNNNATWKNSTGPGGKQQWKTAANPTTMMLTSDISLLHDPEGKFQPWVQLFATDLGALNTSFSHAWYKLMTRDMGPVTRCLGPMVPPPQPFQNPLPSPPAQLPDFEAVRSQIVTAMVQRRVPLLLSRAVSSVCVGPCRRSWLHPSLLHGDQNTVNASVLAPDTLNGKDSYSAVFAHLAFQCGSTFRSTDYQGGCNGARIRFAPENTWLVNTAMDKAMQVCST